MAHSAVPKRAILRILGAGALATVAGFVVVAGLFAGLSGLETAGAGVLLGWLPALGGIAVAAALIWAGHGLLHSSRTWYLAACVAAGAMLALTLPLMVYAVTGN